jgi:hypothetical protein
VNDAAGTITSSLGLGTGGARTITATLDNQGTLDLFPGHSGTLTVTGSLTSSGAITAEVGGLTAGTQYDRLAVTGPITLSGVLNVGLINAFVPVSGNTFTVITHTGARTGTFSTANLASPIAGLPTYLANSITVGVP